MRRPRSECRNAALAEARDSAASTECASKDAPQETTCAREAPRQDQEDGVKRSSEIFGACHHA